MQTKMKIFKTAESSIQFGSQKITYLFHCSPNKKQNERSKSNVERSFMGFGQWSLKGKLKTQSSEGKVLWIFEKELEKSSYKLLGRRGNWCSRVIHFNLACYPIKLLKSCIVFWLFILQFLKYKLLLPVHFTFIKISSLICDRCMKMWGCLFLKLEPKKYHLKMLWMQANKYGIIYYLSFFLKH